MRVNDIYNFIKPLVGHPAEHPMILLPKSHASFAFEQVTENVQEEDLSIPEYNGDDIFLSMIHVALKLHGDLEHCTPMNGFEVSEDNACMIFG